MIKALSLFLAVLGVLLILAGQAVALEEDEFDHMGDDDHMDMDEDDLMLLWGPWPYFGMGFMVYWFFAIPIGLLVYTDAKERRMNGRSWLLVIMIPWVGLFAIFAYLMARHDRPRVDIHDPWAEGDRYMESMRSRGEGR